VRSVLLEELGLGPNDFQPIVVWIAMLPADNWEAAQRAAKIFSDIPFVAQFYDPGRLAGDAVATALDAPGKTAWDIYLRYTRSSRWEARAPRPQDWAHQMSDGAWAGDDKFCQGDALPGALRRLFNGSLKYPT
jgi:hypothetical protein